MVHHCRDEFLQVKRPNCPRNCPAIKFSPGRFWLVTVVNQPKPLTASDLAKVLEYPMCLFW